MVGDNFFNNLDILTDFGIMFKKGAFGELLSLPGAWPDETRKVALPILFMAENEQDFWVKYNAFAAFIKPGDTFILLVNSLHRRFKVKYESMTGFRLITTITGGKRVGSDFTLNLIDDYPDVFIYTRIGSFIKAGTTTSYIFKRTYSSFSQADATELGQGDANFNADGQKYANTQL